MDVTFRSFSITPHKMSKAPGIGGWDSLDTYPKAMQAELLKRYNEKYPKADQEVVSAPPISYQAEEGYDEHVAHFTNFFDAMRGQGTLNEDPVFAFRAAAPSLACNKSHFDREIIKWDPVRMEIKS